MLNDINLSSNTSQETTYVTLLHAEKFITIGNSTYICIAKQFVFLSIHLKMHLT